MQPTFNFPNSMGIECGSTVAKTFTVQNVNATSNVTYRWNTSGWDYQGNAVTSSFIASNSISLTPNTNLPSSVVVTPIVNGEEYPSKTCAIEFTQFNPTSYIIGKGNICLSTGLTETFTLNSVPVNSTVNWTSSDDAVASVSSQSNSQVTINIHSGGRFVLTAAITNSCNQSPQYQPKKGIVISDGLPIPIVDGSEPDPNKIYYQYDDLVIYFEEQNGELDLNPSNFEFSLDSRSDFSLNGVYGSVAVLNVKYVSPFLTLAFQARMKNDCGWSNWKDFYYFLQGYDPYYPYGGYSLSVSSEIENNELNISIDEYSINEETSQKKK